MAGKREILGGWRGERGRRWDSVFARKAKGTRRAIVRAPWTSPMVAHHLAASEIQRCLRGHLVRSHRRDDWAFTRDRGDGAGSLSEPCKKRRGSRRRSRAGRLLEKYFISFSQDPGGSSKGGGELAESGIREGGGGRDSGGFADWCASRLQAWWRMVVVRFKYRYLRFPVYGLAALQIQYLWKSYQQNAIYDMSTRQIKESSQTDSPAAMLEGDVGSSLSDDLEAHHRVDGAEVSKAQPDDVHGTVKSARHDATKKIQDCWRRRVSRKIYRYYRSVIDFKLRGDPRLLLRAINPGEASLFDRAAGIHLRFRLGGLSFPPCIYYKVYTHQPVADIGSFAPRSYVEDRQETPEERWNHGTKNWYQRQENNGWRPITIKVLASAEKDPITVSTAASANTAGGVRLDGGSPPEGRGLFHFSRLVREQCRVARIKQRKRRWLMSIYRAGLSGDSVGEEEAAIDHPPARQTSGTRSDHGSESILGTVLSPLPRTIPKDGGAGGADCGDGTERLRLTDLEARQEDASPDRQDNPDANDPQDNEDDMKLLKWSKHLDLDRYMCEWRQMATSGPSEPWRNADGLAAAVLAATVENKTMGQQHHGSKVPKSPAGRARSTTPTGSQGLRALTFSPLPPQSADGRHKPARNNNCSWDYGYAGDGDARSPHRGGDYVRDACDHSGGKVKDDSGWSPPRGGGLPKGRERQREVREKPSSSLYESTTFDLGSGDCSGGQKWMEEE